MEGSGGACLCREIGKDMCYIAVFEIRLVVLLSSKTPGCYSCFPWAYRLNVDSLSGSPESSYIPCSALNFWRTMALSTRRTEETLKVTVRT